jgi:hypothetical protein
MDDAFRKELERIISASDELSPGVNMEIEKLIQKYNTAGQRDFEGLSPEQMWGLLYSDCGENLIKLKDNKGLDIPLIKQISYYLNIVNASGEIKLTRAGNLPPSIVKEIYSQKFVPDIIIDTGITKLTKETDSMSVELTNILCRHGRLIKKREGKISLTAVGKRILATENFLPVILKTFCSKFNWAYFDVFEDTMIGQFGCYYSIYLLNKYGDTRQESLFYANKYFRALFKDRVGINTEHHHWYVIRTFDRFLKYFGFLEHYDENKFVTRYIKKSPLFNKYIEIQ